MKAPSEGRLSLLVVDDDVVDRAAVRRALRSTDIEVDVAEASDAPEALAGLRRGSYDCVLLDFRLPRADGLAVLRAAREEGLTTPIIVLTGQGDEQLAVEIMKAGAMDYVAKGSLSPDRLRQSVLQAVRVRRAEVAAEAERRRTARLHAFMATLATTQTVPEVAEAVVTEGLAAFDADRGLLSVSSEHDSALVVIRMDGYPDEAMERWRHIPLELDIPLADAVKTREPLFFEDQAAFKARYPHLAAEGPPSRDEALAALPLLVGDRQIGCVGLAYDQARRFADDEIREFVAFARVCAQALERAQLYELAQLERRRAEEASRAKDEFLAVVSHELRTPLNAMLGWTRLLRAGGLPEAQTLKALEVIERNASAQAQLIEDLLDISRITSGKLRLQLRAVDLNDVVRAALDSVGPAADAKGVHVQVTVDPALGRVNGDPDRLQQVVWNFMTNAVKFTPKGGQVRVQVRAVDAHVEVEVSDSGRGIDPAFLPYVFERFRQAEGGAARSHGGLGLGLAIVKNLVELHGGSVEARSEGEGQGATFIARLPFATARADDAVRVSVHQRASEAAPSFTCPPVLAGARVLVVDDDPDGRDLIAAALSQCGASASTAASAAEAMAQITTAPLDVLVSDIGMPGEDGYTLIQRVRALPPESGGRTPAVALTAFARGEDRTRAIAAGYDLHIAKPVEPAELVLDLARLLEKGRPAG